MDAAAINRQQQQAASSKQQHRMRRRQQQVMLSLLVAAGCVRLGAGDARCHCAPLFAGKLRTLQQHGPSSPTLHPPQALAVRAACLCHKSPRAHHIPSIASYTPSLQWKATPPTRQQACLRAHRMTLTCTSFKSRSLTISSSPSGDAWDSVVCFGFVLVLLLGVERSVVVGVCCSSNSPHPPPPCSDGDMGFEGEGGGEYEGADGSDDAVGP